MPDPGHLKQRRDWRDKASIGLAGATLVLVCVNVWFVLNAQTRQVDVNQRQQFINQSMQLGRVNEGLVRAIAAAAVTNKDEKLRKLLSDQGINVTFTPNPATAPDTAPAPDAAAPKSGSLAVPADTVAAKR